MTGIPLWIKALVAFWLALIAGCVVAGLFPSEARAQSGTIQTQAAGQETAEERRHQELVAALSKGRPEASDKTATIIVLVGILQLLQSLGVIGWAKWSVNQIAKEEALKVGVLSADSLARHNADVLAHTAAAEHNHRDLRKAIDEVDAEVTKVDKHLNLLQGLLQRLLTEHSIIHKLQLSRASDIGPDDLFRVPPGGLGGGEPR